MMLRAVRLLSLTLIMVLLTVNGTFQITAQDGGGGPQKHTVQPGENMFRIALRYGLTVDALAAANGITDVTKVYVGQVLTVPGAGQPPNPPQQNQQNPPPANPPDQPVQPTQVPPQNPQPVPTRGNAPVYYTVQAGDTINIISRKFGVTPAELITANRLVNPNHIEPGQQVTIPGVSAPGSSATVPDVGNANIPAPQPTTIPPTAVPPTAIPPTVGPPTAVAAAQTNGTPATYTVQQGEGLAQIARKFEIGWPDLAAANNIMDPNRIYAGMVLKIPAKGGPAPTNMENSVGAPPGPPPSNTTGKLIFVKLREQRIYVYEDGKLLFTSLASTGLPGTPTVQGDFKVYVKYAAQLMTGPGYYLPNVQWVMYFYRDYGLHGTYWHKNFGRPMSHGCVNLPNDVAERLYKWAEVGTPVHVEY